MKPSSSNNQWDNNDSKVCIPKQIEKTMDRNAINLNSVK